MPELNRIRGGRTPSLDKLAKEGVTFTRFYAENICTSTRMAFMTGRYAVRTGMELTKVTPPEGVGMNDREVTIAASIGRWLRHAPHRQVAHGRHQGSLSDQSGLRLRIVPHAQPGRLQFLD